MHPYSTDESRVGVYGGLAVIAVLLAWAIVAMTSQLNWPQWLVSAPSMVATFAAVYASFDRYLWKLRPMYALGIVKVVNIAGVYEGSLVSTWKDPQTGKGVERDVTFKVLQSWTRMTVEMTVGSGTSSSQSTSALGAVTGDGTATCLTYVYKNTVNPGVADQDMGDHDGAADLRIYEDGHVTGRYFNSRPRAGTIRAQLRRKSR